MYFVCALLIFFVIDNLFTSKVLYFESYELAGRHKEVMQWSKTVATVVSDGALNLVL